MSNSKFSIVIKNDNTTIVACDNFLLPNNDITFLFGESGIGKSMLSKAVYGLLDPDELDVTVNSLVYESYCQRSEIRSQKNNSFFVFQEPSSHLNPLEKIRTQLNEGTLANIDDRRILDTLWQHTKDSVLENILSVYPKPFRPSGGEKQRVLLAMAFKKLEAIRQKGAVGQTYFVFDEPTGSLDNRYRNLFLKMLFHRYAQSSFTASIITHDYSIISEIYRSYSPFINNIHFKELRRINGRKVTLQPFSTDEYITWLGQYNCQKIEASAEKKEVLRYSKISQIFNRNLMIYSDKNRTKLADLVINKGEMVYLKAPSGVGKTTIAKIIMGIYEPQQYTMSISGITISEKSDRAIFSKQLWGKKLGMVFQHADESLNLESTVKQVFDALPTKINLTIDTLKIKLSEVFDNDITDVFLSKKVKFLSGGQKQRLNLLRTLILDTNLIILDEPLNGLDFISIKKILSILELKRKQGCALLMISHNEEIFENLIDKDHIYYLDAK